MTILFPDLKRVHWNDYIYAKDSLFTGVRVALYDREINLHLPLHFVDGGDGIMRSIGGSHFRLRVLKGSAPFQAAFVLLPDPEGRRCQRAKGQFELPISADPQVIRLAGLLRAWALAEEFGTSLFPARIHRRSLSITVYWPKAGLAPGPVRTRKKPQADGPSNLL